MSFTFKHKFNFYFIFLFFHTLGTTWLPYASFLRALIFLLGFIYIIFNEKVFTRSLFLLLLLVLFLLNFIFSIDHFGSIRFFSILFPILLCEYYYSRLLNLYSRILSITNVLRVFIFISLLFYFFGDNRVIDNVFGDDGFDFGNQFSGVFESVNYFYFYFFIFISSNIILYKLSKFYSLINIVLIILTSAILVLKFPTINRTFILASIFFFIMIFDNKLFKSFIYLSLLCLIFVLSTNFEFEYLESYGLKTKDFVEYGFFGNRTEIWTGVINIVKSNSYYLYGAGYGNEVHTLNSLKLLDFQNLHAHNTYLSILLEFGLIPTFFILIYMFCIIFRNLSRNKILISLFGSFFIFSLFDSVFKSGFNPGHFLFFSLFIFQDYRHKLFSKND